MSRASSLPLLRRLTVLIGIGASVLFLITQVFAAPVSYHWYSFNATNNTGGASDNARFYAFGIALPNLPSAPAYIPPAFSTTFWPAPTTAVAALWRWVTWSGGAAIPAGQTRWFSVKIQVVPGNNVRHPTGTTFLSQAVLRWNAVSGTAGPGIPLGFQISSPPALYNSTDSPLGGANTNNMVVRNVKYAQSPYAIALDSLRLDNPTVLARFTESLDGTRTGPFVVAPGDTHGFAMHPSILDPVPDGRTILMRGTTEDWNGAQHDFVSQFVLPPALPGFSKVGLWILAVLLAVMGAIYVMRTRNRELST